MKRERIKIIVSYVNNLIEWKEVDTANDEPKLLN